MSFYTIFFQFHIWKWVMLKQGSHIMRTILEDMFVNMVSFVSNLVKVGGGVTRTWQRTKNMETHATFSHIYMKWNFACDTKKSMSDQNYLFIYLFIWFQFSPLKWVNLLPLAKNNVKNKKKGAVLVSWSGRQDSISSRTSYDSCLFHLHHRYTCLRYTECHSGHSNFPVSLYPLVVHSFEMAFEKLFSGHLQGILFREQERRLDVCFKTINFLPILTQPNGMEPDLDRLLTQLATEEPTLKDAPIEKTFLYLVLKVERQKCQLQAAEAELKELRRERDEAQSRVQVHNKKWLDSFVM